MVLTTLVLFSQTEVEEAVLAKQIRRDKGKRTSRSRSDDKVLIFMV
jgi:hypothetical protein